MPTYHYQQGDQPLDGYTIQYALGRGGFGEVYFAVSDAGREVALKAVQNFEEVELRGIGHCMNLKSPNLVTIFDVKQGNDATPWVIMEYVAGPSLRDVLDQSPEGLGESKTLYFMKELCRGVGYLHDAGVVHRDLKPHNVFFEEGLVKIGDYSLSKAITNSHRSGHTMTVGSVHYMAPEISMGRYDKTVDIYALGVMLYEMLKGQPPFTGESVGEVLMKHLNGEPDLDGIAEPFAGAIGKAMQRDPALRFQTAGELADALSARAPVGSDDEVVASLSLVGRPQPSRDATSPQPRPSRSLHETVTTPPSLKDTKDQTPQQRSDAAVTTLSQMKWHFWARATFSLIAIAVLVTTSILLEAHIPDDLIFPLSITIIAQWWFSAACVTPLLAFHRRVNLLTAIGIRDAVICRLLMLTPVVVVFFIWRTFPIPAFHAGVQEGLFVGIAAAFILFQWPQFVDPNRSTRILIGRTLLVGGLSGAACLLMNPSGDGTLYATATAVGIALTAQLLSSWHAPTRRDKSGVVTAPASSIGLQDVVDESPETETAQLVQEPS